MFSHDGVRGLELHASGVWWGRYFRELRVPATSTRPARPTGWGLMLGLGSTFDYDARMLPSEWDRVVTAGLAGPMLEYADRHGSLTTRADLHRQYGFSMVSSLAYPAAAAALEDATIKTELKDRGYYYAQSVTGAATLSLEDGPIRSLLSGARRGLLVVQPSTTATRGRSPTTSRCMTSGSTCAPPRAPACSAGRSAWRWCSIRSRGTATSPGTPFEGVERRISVLAVASF